MIRSVTSSYLWTTATSCDFEPGL